MPVLDPQQPVEMPPHVAACIDRYGLVRVHDYSVGLVRSEGRTFVALYIRDTAGLAATFRVPVAGAHALCADLNAMLSTVPAIKAIIEETLDDPPSPPPPPLPHDSALLFYGPPQRCATCRATGRSPHASPCPDCLAVR